MVCAFFILILTSHFKFFVEHRWYFSFSALLVSIIFISVFCIGLKLRTNHIVLLFVLVLFVLFCNLSKITNAADNLTGVSSLWVSNLDFLFIVFCFLLIIANKKSVMFDAYTAYVYFLSIFLILSILIWCLFFLGVPLDGLFFNEISPDIKNILYYYNCYYLNYIPSWLMYSNGIGGHVTPLTSIFWEPGMLGFYAFMIYYIERECIKRRSCYISNVFFVSGLLSFSLLFYISFFIYCMFFKSKLALY